MSGKEFRKWRRVNEYTQQQIADFCNIDKSTISKWENEVIIISDKIYNNINDFITANLVTNEAYE